MAGPGAHFYKEHPEPKKSWVICATPLFTPVVVAATQPMGQSILLRWSGAPVIRVCQLCAASLNTHYFNNLCRGLEAAGIYVLPGSLAEPMAPSWLAAAKEMRYFSLNAASRLTYPRAIKELAALLRRERIDILQTHLFEAAVVGTLAARLARIPLLVMTRHHTDEVWRAASRLHYEIDRLMGRAADHVIGLSHAVRNQMIEREGHKKDNVEVIYQGFDFESLSPTAQDRERIRSEFGLQSSFVIGCVARFFKTKGHGYLFSAARELLHSIPQLRVLLLGDGDREPILAAVREHKLEDRVIFAGHRSDVSACMSAMDVMVHPSETEAFCQVIIEGMATGSVVVSTNVGGAAEVIQSGENGILIPAADPKAIIDAVSLLYRDPALRQRMALAGQKTVRERFTVDRMIARHLECYRSWLGQELANGHSAHER